MVRFEEFGSWIKPIPAFKVQFCGLVLFVTWGGLKEVDPVIFSDMNVGLRYGFHGSKSSGREASTYDARIDVRRNWSNRRILEFLLV